MSHASHFDLTPESIAARYGIRPGCRLVTASEAGLPIYSLRLRALVMEQKPVPPISEFVLRCLDAGLREENEISGTLGLEPSLVREAMVALRCAEEIDLVAPPGSRMQSWSVTQKGARTLRTAAQVMAEEVSLTVYYDALLRKVVWLDDLSLVTPANLRSTAMTEIRPIPARPPHLEEISVQEVNGVIKQLLGRRNRRRDLLVIRSIIGSRILFRPSVMLVYQKLNGSEIQVAFALDGMLSAEHETAFAAAEGPRKLLIAKGVEKRPASQIAEELLTPEVVRQLGDLDTVEAIQDKLAEAQAESSRIELAMTRARTDNERDTVREQAGTAREKLAQATSAVANLQVRLVSMLEHRKILERAIGESKTRLLINSPWMTSSVVTFELLKQLENRLRTGLKVYIAYGIAEEGGRKRPSRAEVQAESDLKNLARTYKNLRLTRLGDTHAKALVSDSAYAVVTSFNWLSFRGDPNRTFRDERGVMILIPLLVDAQFDAIVRRMDEAESRPTQQAAPAAQKKIGGTKSPRR